MKTLEQIIEQEKLRRTEDGDFGINACRKSIEFAQTVLKQSLFSQLENLVKRANEDVYFNKHMVLACWEMINENAENTELETELQAEAERVSVREPLSKLPEKIVLDNGVSFEEINNDTTVRAFPKETTIEAESRNPTYKYINRLFETSDIAVVKELLNSDEWIAIKVRNDEGVAVFALGKVTKE